MKKNIMRAAVMVTSLVLAGNVFGQVTPFSVNAGDDALTGWSDISNGTGGVFTDQPSGLTGDYWGLYSGTSGSGSMVFAFGETLTVGQYVEITASIGFIGNGATVGFGLQNSSNVNRFEAYYIGQHAENAWKINDAGGQEDITGPSTSFLDTTWNQATAQEVTFRFTQLTSDDYSFAVNGTSITNTGLTLTASDISQIRIFNANAGDGSDHDQFFNNLAVIPEPSSILMVGLGGLAAAVMLRRKRG